MYVPYYTLNTPIEVFSYFAECVEGQSIARLREHLRLPRVALNLEKRLRILHTESRRMWIHFNAYVENGPDGIFALEK